MGFAIGDAVTWVSSCVKKEGFVVQVIPPGERPDPVRDKIKTPVPVLVNR